MDMYVAIAKELLKSVHARPVCVDVGSAGGFHQRLEAVRSEVDIIGFDADPDECARLNAAAKQGERHINAAIGRENEKITLELHKKRKTSSCYKTNMDRVSYFYDAERFTPEGEISFTTHSLDAICASEGIKRIDYIKVDVEGHELAVLEGCAKVFLFAELEVYFHPFREGACSFDQIMSHMRQRGYILMDLRRNYWSPKSTDAIRNYSVKGMLMFGDALFCLDPFLKVNQSAWSTAEARAGYLALLSLYGYTAEALMFIDVLKGNGSMPTDEAEIFKGIIMRGSVRRKCKARLGRIMLLMEKWMQFPIAVRSGLSLSAHCQGDGELGNLDERGGVE
ncbi:MAG: FkbM family methyltransferase [Candidatus Omnitrophica bacterium]|nr:FkbM family methyltransferase [Candidatus Omnitrophota bacterium]